MYDKKTKRSLRNFFVRLALRGFVVLVTFIPLSGLRYLGASVGRLFYNFSLRYRKIADDNLKIVFPGKDEHSCRIIMRDSFILLGENGSDTVWFITRSHKKRRLLAEISGSKFLDEALKKRKGVIVVTAHMGAFTILGGILAAQGYKVNYILRSPRDKKMTDILGRGLRMQQVKPIFTHPSIKCVNESIGALRRNEVLIILTDQDIGDSGIFINFFGQPASTPAGTMILSLRTGASIVPMFMVKENNKHKLIIQSEFKVTYEENAENTVLENTRKLNRLVEDAIIKYPEQWSWVDRRWKTQIKPRLTELKQT